ncbi:hypothetical protein BP00DRAFT_173625 [Aspergillus indologenus CBS 114.80]|uniref:Uncharacterized protein n=1 Tax=Aspergillus indologenus CBS 114.80 TaxID=1450541 RepID=A0A2V5J2M7_9EURO|nr:hypothetical protein BP00DRAFT_173625 [Aspergillus indologenus CBS 114.80]
MRPANRYAEWVTRLRRLFPDTDTETYTITATPRETQYPGELTLNYTELTVSTPVHGIFLIVITAHPREESQPHPTAALARDTIPPDNFLDAELARRKRLLWECWPVVVRDGLDVVGLVALGAGWEGAPEAVVGFRVDYNEDPGAEEEDGEGEAGLVECVRGFVGGEGNPRASDGLVERFLVGVRVALRFVPGCETVMESVEVVELD